MGIGIGFAILVFGDEFGENVFQFLSDHPDLRRFREAKAFESMISVSILIVINIIHCSYENVVNDDAAVDTKRQLQ